MLTSTSKESATTSWKSRSPTAARSSSIHDAAQEMWIAAKAGGFHYRWNGGVWQDTRQDEEMMAALARLISLQAKKKVSLL